MAGERIRSSPRRRSTLRRHLGWAVGLDHNPLCRRVDRARSRLALATPLLLLLAAACAVLAAELNLREDRAKARAEAERLHRVEAVLTVPVPAAGGTPTRDALPRGRAEATWVSATGETVTGRIPVQGDTRPGPTVTIWIDDSGAPVRAPRSDLDMRGSAVTVGVGTMAVLSLIAVAVLGTVERHVERRAEALWGPGWEQVEPVWSGRSRGSPGGHGV